MTALETRRLELARLICEAYAGAEALEVIEREFFADSYSDYAHHLSSKERVFALVQCINRQGLHRQFIGWLQEQLKERRPDLLKRLLELQELDQGATKASATDWNEAKNARRCDLIDKKIEGTISAEESVELAALQAEAVAYRDRVAPLPMAGARAIHKELLQKKRQATKAP